MNSGAKSVLSLPFSERRYIAVLDDEEFDRKRAQASTLVYAHALTEVLPLVVPGGLLIRAAATLATGLTAEWVRGRAANSPKIVRHSTQIQAIPLREANRFMFLGGCAEVGRAYAANPLEDRTYYSVETYNDDMIDHKLSELERILNALGARHYEIIFNSDEQLDLKSEVGFRKGSKIKAELELRNARAKRYERSGTSVGREPVLPSQLVWLEREPSWKALVESRLEHGRKDFSLRVNLERDLQLSAKINADFKILGLETGADYKKKINFSLAVKGSFGD